PGDRFESCKDFMTAAREALGAMADPPPASASAAIRLPQSEPSAPYPAAAEPVTAVDARYSLPPESSPPAELAHEPADDYQPPTASWPSVAATPPRAPADAPAPASAPGPPGGGKGSRRRWWLVAAAAAVLVAGGTGAAVTMALTGGHGSPSAGSATTPAAGANPAAAGATASGGAPGLAVPTVAGKITVGQTPSFIRVAPNGKFAYATNPGAGAVTVIDTATDKVSGTIKIPQGPPQFVSFSPDSKTAYVSVYNTRRSVHTPSAVTAS